MTPDAFRKLALALPGAEESAHMGHPDFRVGGKIFATLGAPDASFGMVALTREQQEGFIDFASEVFAPVKGGWGERGATNVRLAAATAATLRPALEVAWRNRAPAKLLKSVTASDARAGKANPASRQKPTRPKKPTRRKPPSQP
jgi:hypothetical protein